MSANQKLSRERSEAPEPEVRGVSGKDFSNQ